MDVIYDFAHVLWYILTGAVVYLYNALRKGTSFVFLLFSRKLISLSEYSVETVGNADSEKMLINHVFLLAAA